MPNKTDRSAFQPRTLPALEDVDLDAAEARRQAGRIDELETRSEDPRAARDRAELERWNALASAAWARPETIAEAVVRARGRKTIWLSEAVDLMAFGAEEPPQDDLEAGARRLQACKALCGAAADGAFPLVGILGENSERPETIARAYFDSDYRIGQGSNVLELDGSGVPEKDDAKFDRLHRQKWFDVRIGDKEAFFEWLSGESKKDLSEAHADSLSLAPVVTGGRGAVTRAIQHAFKSEFPMGLPVGTSSQVRNGKIRDRLVEILGPRSVSDRTIQRAIGDMSSDH